MKWPDDYINKVIHGNCLDVMKEMPDGCVHSIVTDPPYELGFMGKHWDKSGIAYNVEVWQECLRVLKPGGHLLAFGGSRTYHRMACAIEDAGFEIRDQIMWLYGSGFPKSLDVSKAIDKAAGVNRTEVIGTRHRNVKPFDDERGWNQNNTTGEHQYTAPATDSARQWSGWGTALKPAHEPIVVARKPLTGTVAENVLAHGTGAMNIDGCRVEYSGQVDPRTFGGSWRTDKAAKNVYSGGYEGKDQTVSSKGRWPANVIHDGSEEVVGRFPYTTSGKPTGKRNVAGFATAREHGTDLTGYGDSGSAARFFYCAKASKQDRKKDNHHPTVKPHDLMRYLCRLVTPHNGIILDPFSGSGSTCKAAAAEGFRYIGIDKESKYCAIAEERLCSITPQQIQLLSPIGESEDGCKEPVDIPGYGRKLR